MIIVTCYCQFWNFGGTLCTLFNIPWFSELLSYVFILVVNGLHVREWLLSSVKWIYRWLFTEFDAVHIVIYAVILFNHFSVTCTKEKLSTVHFNKLVTTNWVFSVLVQIYVVCWSGRVIANYCLHSKCRKVAVIWTSKVKGGGGNVRVDTIKVAW